MRSINTVVPVPTETIKQLLTSDPKPDIIIDVAESSLQGQSFLTYLTNLGLEVTLDFTSTDDYFALLTTYMRSPMLHDFRQLERGVLELLLQIKGFKSESGIDYHSVIVDPEHRDVIYRWLSVIESLSLYNMKWTGVSDESIFDQHEVMEDRDLMGVNYVKLIGHDIFPLLLVGDPITPLCYYQDLYDKPLYQGSPLESFWCHAENPVFLIGVGIQQGTFDETEFAKKLDTALTELGADNVPFL